MFQSLQPYQGPSSPVDAGEVLDLPAGPVQTPNARERKTLRDMMNYMVANRIDQQSSMPRNKTGDSAEQQNSAVGRSGSQYEQTVNTESVGQHNMQNLTESKDHGSTVIGTQSKQK